MHPPTPLRRHLRHPAYLQKPNDHFYAAALQKEKNSEIHSTIEILPNIAVISLSTPPIAVINPVECSTTTTALETRPATGGFMNIHPEVENSAILPKKTTGKPFSQQF
jgi:hypothetical protein